MASGTINSITINKKIACKIEWDSIERSSDNTSVVRAFLYCKRTSTSGTIEGAAEFTISIDGESTTISDFLSLTDDEWLFVASAEKTVSHMYNGTKSIYISARVFLDGTSIFADCGKNVDLDTIPIASELYEILPSQLTVSVGLGCTPKWRNDSILSESFWHKLVFSLGEWNTTIEKIPPGTKNYYLRLPKDLAYQIPNNTDRGTMTVTLYTYESENAQTHIGSPSSLNYTVVLDQTDFEPFCYRKLNPVTSNAKFSSLYLQGISKVSATLSGKGTYGAYIESLTMLVGDERYSFKPNNQPEEWVSDITLTSDILHEGGDVRVRCFARDSRGRLSDMLDTTINVIPYGSPKILPASDDDRIICARCDKDGKLSNSGTYLKIKARRSYFTVTSEGEQKNFCEVRYRYRTESDTDFSDWITILDKSKIDTDTIAPDPIPGVVSATDTAYVVQVGVIDDVGESDASTFNIPTDFVVLDIPASKQGKRIGVGRFAANSNTPGVDLGMDLYFDDETIYGAFADVVDEIATHETSDTSGSWWYRKWRSGTYDICGTFTVQPSKNNMYDGGGCYSNQIQIQLPSDIMSLEYIGTPIAKPYWLINSALVETENGKKIGFQLAGFVPIDTSNPVSIQLVGHGKYKT